MSMNLLIDRTVEIGLLSCQIGEMTFFIFLEINLSVTKLNKFTPNFWTCAESGRT